MAGAVLQKVHIRTRLDSPSTSCNHAIYKKHDISADQHCAFTPVGTNQATVSSSPNSLAAANRGDDRPSRQALTGLYGCSTADDSFHLGNGTSLGEAASRRRARFHSRIKLVRFCLAVLRLTIPAFLSA
jgi:hypothetical protein